MATALENTIIKPLITEKVSMHTEQNNTYGFEVALKANKRQIKDAVETFYNVKVLNVNTSILPGKLRRSGRLVKKTGQTKKALVQIEAGQKIELFKGV